MIKLYKETDQGLETSIIPAMEQDTVLEPRSWLSITDATAEMMEIISGKTNIPLHFLMSALDEEESARIDTENGNVLIVLDAPLDSDDETTLYTTKPFIITYNDNYFITINQYNENLVPEMLSKMKNIEPQKPVRTTLNLFYQMSKEFISYLKAIDDDTKDIEQRLHSSMKNREIFELMAINKSLVYFSTALSANKAVLSKLIESPSYKKFSADVDMMEDAKVELDQAIEMCSIYRKILEGMMSAFSSIISNNLNIVMKTLSVLTIAISIPTLIASFYGMNFTDIPLSEKPWGFYLIIALAIFLAVVGGVILVLITRNNHNKN